MFLYFCLFFPIDRNQKRFVVKQWRDIRVGDFVHLSCNETVPADILILRSKPDDAGDDCEMCYIETSNLDGESNLKQRFVVKGFSKVERVESIDFNFKLQCDKPNMKLHKFNGIIIFNDPKKESIAVNKDNIVLRDCELKNTSFVEGLVIYAGHETKAMLNNKGPRLKRSRLERLMNGDIIWCIVILIVLCTFSALGRKFWLEDYTGDHSRVPFLTTDVKPPLEFLSFIWIFFTFMILYQMIIPISLYVTIEMVKLGQIYYIHNDKHLFDNVTKKRIECRALNITEDLGQVEYIFCDKTGTLTENKMKFRCCSINGIDFSHEVQFTETSRNMTYEECKFKVKIIF